MDPRQHDDYADIGYLTEDAFRLGDWTDGFYRDRRRRERRMDHERASGAVNRFLARMLPDSTRVVIWDAINEYAASCGGDTSEATVSDRRMNAVAAVERAIGECLRASHRESANAT